MLFLADNPIFSTFSQILKNLIDVNLVFWVQNKLYSITNILVPSTKHLTIYKCEKCLSQKVVFVTGGNNYYRETI